MNKAFFRALQTNFPFLQDIRFLVQRNYRKFLRKVHEEDFNALAFFPKKAGDLYLDIGANRGDAIQSILMHHPNCQIVGFEPNPLVYRKLKRRYSNSKNVKLINSGLGNEEGELSLNLPFYKNYMFDGLASFDEQSASEWLRGRLFEYKQKHFSMKKLKCPIKQLDSFSLQPYFMKLDVQGYEKEVLLGAVKTLETYKPVLLIEAADPEITELLTSFGYKAYTFTSKQLVPGYGDLNTFYISDDKISQINK